MKLTGEEAAAKSQGRKDAAGVGRGGRGWRPKVELLVEPRGQPVHHVGPHLVWFVYGAWFGASPVGVLFVDVTAVSVAVIPVFEALVQCGGVIRTLARHSWLWICQVLVATAAAAATTVPVASSQSTLIVESATLLLSCKVGRGCLLL